MKETSHPRRHRAFGSAGRARRPLGLAIAFTGLAIGTAPAWAAPTYGPANLQQGASSCIGEPGAAVARDMNAEVASSIYVLFDHEPYFVGSINQGGIGIYETFTAGEGRVVSAPALSLDWPGPRDGQARAFLGYTDTLQANAAADTESAGTLSITVPAHGSVDLGDIRRTSVPAADMGALLAVGLVAMVRLRRRNG